MWGQLRVNENRRHPPRSHQAHGETEECDHVGLLASVAREHRESEEPEATGGAGVQGSPVGEKKEVNKWESSKYYVWQSAR